MPGVFVSPELEQNSLPEGNLHTQGVGTVAVKLKKRKLETEQKPENIFYSDSLFLELLHSIHLVPIIYTSSSMYSVDVQPCHLQYCYLVPALVEKHYLVGCSVVWRSSSFSRMLPGQHPGCQPGCGCGVVEKGMGPEDSSLHWPLLRQGLTMSSVSFFSSGLPSKPVPVKIQLFLHSHFTSLASS